MKEKLTITREYVFEFDLDNENTIESLDDFRAIYGDPNAEIGDLLDHIVYNIENRGCSIFIEGVGYIAVDGQVQGSPYSGINLITETFN